MITQNTLLEKGSRVKVLLSLESECAQHCTVCQTVKFPPRIMVWGMTSGSGLSELHFVPLKQTVNAEYFINEILEKSCLPTLKRRKTTGPVTQQKMCRLMFEAILCRIGLLPIPPKRRKPGFPNIFQGYWQKEFGLATHRILIPLKIFGRLFKQSLTRRDQPLTCRAP